MSTLLFMVAAATALAPGSENPTSNCLEASSNDHANASSLFHIRRSRVAHELPPTLSQTTGVKSLSEVATITGSGNGGKVLGYTRLRARFSSCGEQQRDYAKEKRDPVLRYFLGKETHKGLTLTVRVSPLDVKSTSTLARFDRLSGRKGEDWTTSIENDRLLLPYFRVDLSSSIDIQSELVSTREYSSTIVAGSFAVVEKAAALISPSTVLITAENKNRFNDAANFVDSSVNGLLHVSITERLRETALLNDLPNDVVLATIVLVLPRSNDVYSSVKSTGRAIGKWEIVAEPFRPSLFGNAPQGAPLPMGELSAASILNFLINDGKSLRESLAGASAVTTARDAVVKAPTDSRKAMILCRAVAAESDRLGLTPVDASAAAWAYLADMALEESQPMAACRALELFPS